MSVVNVKNIKIGEGIPKICASILGRSKEEIQRESNLLKKKPIDIMEWRVDWYDKSDDLKQVIEGAQELRFILGNIPLLFTFRTKSEGGQKAIDLDDYVKLNVAAARCGYVDIIDVELFTGEEEIAYIIEEAHSAGVKVIVSNHDFDATPTKAEMVRRLCKMQELGADIPKLAVMPQSRSNVLDLLEATTEMAEYHSTTPVITMSMAGMGMLTRLAGEVFGSAVTFGAGHEVSAPGQIDVHVLHNLLCVIHESQNK